VEEVHDRKDRKGSGWLENERKRTTVPGDCKWLSGKIYIWEGAVPDVKRGECRLAAPVAVRGLLPYPVKRACPFYGDASTALARTSPVTLSII